MAARLLTPAKEWGGTVRAGVREVSRARSGASGLMKAVSLGLLTVVRLYLKAGADPGRRNRNGSTARDLATRTTGRSGSGMPEAKAQQAEILGLLSRP